MLIMIVGQQDKNEWIPLSKQIEIFIKQALAGGRSNVTCLFLCVTFYRFFVSF